MPQAIAPAIVAAFGVSAATALVIAQIITTILINVALGQLSKLLTKKPKVDTPPINVTVRNTVENRRIVFGTMRTGGAFVFYKTTGLGNKFLWYVIALAGHQVADIKDIWLDTQRVVDSIINGGAPEGGAVTSGNFANKLWIYKHLGTSNQVVDPELATAFGSSWDSNHLLLGTGYIVVKMEHDTAKYPQGAPQSVTALMDGALLYDPRRDSTNGGTGTHRRGEPNTWEFDTIGRNPALQWRWYVAGGSVHNDSVTRLVKYGLNDDARIDDPVVIAAANLCDETLSGANAPPSGSQSRYRSDLEFSTGETRREILEDILATMAGTHVVVHGKHRLYGGAYHAPTHTFAEIDLYGQFEVEDSFDHERRYNQVAGVFRDSAQEYVEQTTIFRTDASYQTQDGGKALPIEIDLRGVTDTYQAQRLCEIKLRKSRMMRAVKLVGALNLLKVAPFETLSYSHARYTWAGRIFRCLERGFEFGEEAGRVVLTCQREDAAVYTDLLTADYTTGTSTTDTFANETPNPPINLRTTGLLNAILVAWDPPTVIFPGTAFEARVSTASSMTSPTTVYQGPDLQFMFPMTTTADRFFQVRSVRNAQPSDWVPATNGVLGKAAAVSLALSATVSPGSAQVQGGAASLVTNSVTVTASGGTSPYTFAWTWFSGGASITIDAATAATTTFSATGLTAGQTRSGVARCTVTDNVTATYTIDVDVTITRLAASISAPAVNLSSWALTPTNASVAFRVDADGHWYSSVTTAVPTTDRGLWSDPVDYAADYEIRITRTGGTETVFTSGPALGGTNWHALTADREWRLTDTTSDDVAKTIIFTIEIRRASDSVVVSTTTNNQCTGNKQSGL